VLIVPRGCYGRIVPANELSAEGVFASGGIVDCDYRGGVRIHLFNTTASTYEITRGTVVAQIVFDRVSYPELLELNRGIIRLSNGI